MDRGAGQRERSERRKSKMLADDRGGDWMVMGSRSVLEWSGTRSGSSAGQAEEANIW